MTLPDVDDLNTVGGAKSNYHAVEDPTTDEDAAHRNIAFANAVAMTQTLPRAWARITLAATTGAMVRVAHAAVWGNSLGVAPTPARTSTGLFTLTWPTTVVDPLGVTRTLNLRGAMRPNVRGSTLYHTMADITSANVCTFRIFNTSDALNDAAGVDVDILVW